LWDSSKRLTGDAPHVELAGECRRNSLSTDHQLAVAATIVRAQH
jgi:hypothetical protein